MKESEIFKEAVLLGLKFGLAFAFIITVTLGGLFGYYIHKSYSGEIATMTATQDGTNNYQEVVNGKADD